MEANKGLHSFSLYVRSPSRGGCRVGPTCDFLLASSSRSGRTIDAKTRQGQPLKAVHTYGLTAAAVQRVCSKSSLQSPVNDINVLTGVRVAIIAF